MSLSAVSFAATGSSQKALLAQISSAHLVSHFHILSVPVLLPLLPAVMGASFVELGVAISIFSIVSGMVQAPLGYVVDRFGARRVLMSGLTFGSAGFALLAASPDYYTLLVVMVLGGVANGVYHPSNYSLLAQGISSEKMGRAFSIHTFAGYVGGVIASVVLVPVAMAFGVRWGFVVSSLLGLLVLTMMLTNNLAIPAKPKPLHTRQLKSATVRSPPVAPAAVLVLMVFFLLLSLSTGAIDRFSVSALVRGFNVDLSTANLALTGFLAGSALGVLAGGFLADHTSRHGLLAAVAFAAAAALVLIVILAGLKGMQLIGIFAATGFLTGIVAPSRDMLVRSSAPPGAEGRIFGIVATGFNIGGVVGPLLFGFLLDNGFARAVLWSSAGFMIATTATVILQERRQRSN